MPYPITFSISERLRTPVGACPKTAQNTSDYAAGFTQITVPSVTAFAEAVGPKPNTNGAGFCFGIFEDDYRHRSKFISASGIGIDFDKITPSSEKKILWDECERRLPTLEQLLNTRIGPFIRMVYLSQTCPNDASYVMGRAILSFGRDLNFDECKALSMYLINILSEDLPAADPEELKKIDLAGGIDAGAIKDPVRWWAGPMNGRKPLYINEDAMPIPNALLDCWVGEGRQWVVDYSNSNTVITDHIELNPQTLKVFDVIIRDILKPSGYNSYGSTYRWVKSFVQQCRPHLDEAFEGWMNRSPYRLERIGHNPRGQIYHTRQMDFSSIPVVMKVIREDSPDWHQRYYELTGEYPHFDRAALLCESDDDDYRMNHHPAEAFAALKALGL